MTTEEKIIEDWEEMFDNEFPAMGISGDPKDNCIYRHDQYINDKSLLKQFIKSLLQQHRKDVLEEAHNTEDGYCCACDYDIAVMEGKIKQARKETIEKSIKLIKEKGLHLGYANNIIDLLQTLTK